MKIAAPPLLALSLLAPVIAGAARPYSWELIGERTVDHGANREMIEPPQIVYATHLRLCADRKAVRFDALEVQFRNGSDQSIPLEATIPAGRCTNDIALRSPGARDIHSVMLSYQAAGDEAVRPRVLVFARSYRLLS